MEAQIEETLRGANTAKNIYDLAVLCIVRDHLAADTPQPVTYAQDAGPVEEKEQPEPMIRAADPYGGQAPYHGTGTLTKQDAQIWVGSLLGADGTRGARWSMADVRSLAEQRGYTTEAELVTFWAVMNLLRADFAEVAKHWGVNNAEFYADMARAWINDPDAVEDKAGAYLEYIVR